MRQCLWIGLVTYIVFSASLFPAPSSEAQAAQTEATSDASAVDTTPRSALLRSMLIPGWGQYYNKRYFKSALIFGASCALTAGMIYENQQLQRSSTDVDRRFYREQRNTFGIWLLGTILYGMADAYVDAHLRDFDEEMQEMVLRMELTRSSRPFLVYRILW